MVKIVGKYVILIIVLSITVFAISRSMPITPMEMLLSNGQLPSTKENISVLEKKWGLDAPVSIQYITWASNFFKGDWGYSLTSAQPIKEEFFKRAPYSLFLGLGSIVIGAILAFFLGLLASIKGGLWAKFIRLWALATQTIPIFISGVFIVYILSVRFKFFHFFTRDNIEGLVIGTLVLAIYHTGELVRVSYIHFQELKEKPYVLRLYAQGFSLPYMLLKHGYKPIIHSLSGTIASKLSGVLGGSVVIEFAFTIPGMSYFIVESMMKRDYFVLQSYLMVMVLWMFIVHMLLEGVQRVIIPKEVR